MGLDLIQIAQEEITQSFRILYYLLTNMLLILYCGKEDKTHFYRVMGTGVESLEVGYPWAKGEVELWDQPQLQ